MEHDVVGDITDRGDHCGECRAKRDASGLDVVIFGHVQVGAVNTGDDQEFVGDARPVGAEHDDVVVLVDDSLVHRLLGLDGGAQQAAGGESCESSLLFGELSGDEAHAEQLSVGVFDRGARLTAGVDDGLGVAEVL